MARVLSRNSLMPDNLALLYMKTERSCQLRFPHAAKSAQSIEIRLVVSWWKYGRSLPLPLLEIKTFSRLKGDFNMFFQSRVNSTHPGVICNAVDGQHVSRRAGINRVRVGIAAKVVEAGHHRILKPFVHNVFAPEVAHAILDPFEIRDRYAAGVREDIRDYKDSLLIKDFVGRRGSWAIRSLCQNFAL